MTHLALAVRDEERSRRFYETYFGFGARPAERMADGVLMLHDAAGFALALKETDGPISLPAFFHFAFASASTPEEVRRLPRPPAPGRGSHRRGVGGARLRERQVPRSGRRVVEVAWEPE